MLAAGVLSVTRQAKAQFTPGDIVVEQVGTTGSSTALSSAATAVYIDQFSPTTVGATNPSPLFSLPAAMTAPTPSGTAGTTPNTVQLNLTESGTASSDGFLSLSADRSALVLSGYNAGLGGNNPTGATASADPRVVGVISAAGAINTTTYSIAADTSNNFRSVASATGTSFYSSGSGSSASATNYFANIGAASATNLGTTVGGTAVTNTEVNEIFTVNGTQSLYYSTTKAVGSGTIGIYTYGGLPTASPAAATQVLAVAVNGTSTPYAFSISPDGKTVYVADGDSAAGGGGILKYTSSTGAAGSFVLAGTFATPARGLTVDYTDSDAPILYATTTASSANSLFSITDNGSTFGSLTATTLATASANTDFEGVAFAPTPVPEPATVFGGVLLVGALGRNQRRRLRGRASKRWLRLPAQA